MSDDITPMREVELIRLTCLRKDDGPVTVNVMQDDGTIKEVPLQFEDGAYVYRLSTKLDRAQRYAAQVRARKGMVVRRVAYV